MGWRISSQQASKRFNESFLAIARDNEGIWLPIDPRMFLTLRADEEVRVAQTLTSLCEQRSRE